jgi:hypothetical protein
LALVISLVAMHPASWELPAASPKLEIGIWPDTMKVFPDSDPAGPHSTQLTAAIGEVVSFQIAVRSDVGTSVPLLSRGNGVALFEAQLVNTPRVADWGYPAEFPEHRRSAYPDPLVPITTLGLEAGRTRAVWVRMRAEESHRGEVLVGGMPVAYELDVLPFELPRRPSLQTSIGLGGVGFARVHGVVLHSKDYWRLYESYADSLLEHRLTPMWVPWGLRDPRARQYLTDERVTTIVCEYSGDAAQMRSLWEELGTLGIRDRVWFYNLDEPDSLAQYEVVRNQVSWLRDVFPGHRYGLTFFTGAPDKSTPFDHLAGVVNLWIVQTDYFAHGHGLGDKVRAQARERAEAGDEVFLYTALAPRAGFCNLMINHTALEHRLLFWQLYAEEVPTGFLYWQSTYWDHVEDPWTDQATLKHIDHGLWGDGSLFYPGPAGPVGSIRLELIRAGMQDFELLKLAEEARGRDEVMAVAGRVAAHLMHATADPKVLEAARRELQQMVVGGYP